MHIKDSGDLQTAGLSVGCLQCERLCLHNTGHNESELLNHCLDVTQGWGKQPEGLRVCEIVGYSAFYSLPLIPTPDFDVKLDFDVKRKHVLQHVLQHALQH